MSFENDFKIIKNLTEIQGCSGNENKIREYIRKIVEPYSDSIEIDSIGNLYCYINSNVETKHKKLNILLDAHIDEKL